MVSEKVVFSVIVIVKSVIENYNIKPYLLAARATKTCFVLESTVFLNVINDLEHSTLQKCDAVCTRILEQCQLNQ